MENMRNRWWAPVLPALLAAAALSGPALAQTTRSTPSAAAAPVAKITFGDDLAFLRQHLPVVVVLSDPSSQTQVVLAPTLQGRVMTSTAAGPDGLSYGWINRPFITAGKQVAHLNPYGGEERFWIGPEGGRYALFFKPGVKQDFDNWNTPAFLDTEPFNVTSQSPNRVSFTRTVAFENYAGTPFKVRIDRMVRLLPPAAAARLLGVTPDSSLKLVAFESVNKLTNVGDQPWTRDKGLLDIWLLGMFNPTPQTTVVVPYTAGPEAKLGKLVTADYFGQVPPDRLQIGKRAMFLRADGKQRGKIGVSPARSRNIAGSYDSARHVLTLVQYSKPRRKAAYLNMKWTLTEDPYEGDSVNSYNDGPLADGSQMGPFYELETVSPAFALKPGQSRRHVNRIFHFQGEPAALDKLAQATLGVSLQEITQAFAAAKP